MGHLDVLRRPLPGLSQGQAQWSCLGAPGQRAEMLAFGVCRAGAASINQMAHKAQAELLAGVGVCIHFCRREGSLMDPLNEAKKELRGCWREAPEFGGAYLCGGQSWKEAKQAAATAERHSPLWVL